MDEAKAAKDEPIKRAKALARGRRRLERMPDLVTHLDVAAKFGVKPQQWRYWVQKGMAPRPHSSIGRVMFYDVSLIIEKLRTGYWPSRTKFHGYDPYPEEPYYPPIEDEEDPKRLPKTPPPPPAPPPRPKAVRPPKEKTPKEKSAAPPKRTSQAHLSELQRRFLSLPPAKSSFDLKALKKKLEQGGDGQAGEQR